MLVQIREYFSRSFRERSWTVLWQSKFFTKFLDGKHPNAIAFVILATEMYLVEFRDWCSFHEIKQGWINIFFTAFALHCKHWPALFQDNEIYLPFSGLDS
jgi:hypothetical protein